MSEISTETESFFLSCRTLHLSVIQEEIEEISPAITLLRRPRFSRHFGKRNEDKDLGYPPAVSPRPRASSLNEVEISKPPESREARPEEMQLQAKCRRSSDSSLPASPFRVLPPIQTPDTEESEEARKTAGTDPGEVADSEDVKSSNEESGNKNEIDTLVAEAIAEKKKTNNGNSNRSIH